MDVGECSQFVQSHPERVGCRVIGVVSECRDPPQRIGRWRRSLCAMAKTAESGQMMVGNSNVCEGVAEGIGVELRVGPRTGDRAHINDQIDRSLPEQGYKFGDRARRVTYRQNRRHGVRRHADQYTKPGVIRPRTYHTWRFGSCSTIQIAAAFRDRIQSAALIRASQSGSDPLVRQDRSCARRRGGSKDDG